MAQNKLLDPVVSSPAVLTGTGNGTLTIDRLTHFTITQTYVATCIAISPSTVFSVVGSLDGPVGLATVGNQFTDVDLKVFLTIQQGVTPFIVGDYFTFGVSQGTDLSQDNIDNYDELPQKNFGLGNRGAISGDHNIRYSDTARKAFLYHQDLYFEAVTGGNAGNSIQVQYTSGTAGSEVASASGNLISITMESGVSTATQILAAINAAPTVLALISASIVGNGPNPQFDSGTLMNLSGGKDKQFAFNHNELTDSGAFVEGNASVLAKDVYAQGRLKVDGHAALLGTLSLSDASADNQSGEKVANVQQHLNRLIQDQKIIFKTSDDTKLSWNKPSLTFEADINIKFTDSAFTNTILVANSPITIADGQHVYVIVDRSVTKNLTPIVASSVPTIINAVRIASRYGDNLVLADNTLLRDGKSARIGEGGEGSTIRADLYDPVSTTLPTGTNATIDGVNVTNGMLVLFSNLSSGNNRVYKVSGVGVSLVWTVQSVFSTGVAPALGDQIVITQGTGFGLTEGIFDGTTFKFNDKVRFFNGVNYWELSSIQSATLLASTTANVFSITASGSENIIVDYSVIRGSNKETGTLHVTTDGTSVSLSTSGTELGTIGISFSADINAGNIRIRYTSTAGSSATMKYYVRRWSDAAGGPGGVPSYSASSGQSAAGSNTQIQFNDGGFLGADSDFTWDKTNNVLTMSGMEVTGLQGPVILTDNTTNGTAITLNAASYPFVIIEYSISRNAAREVGRMLIANDGTLSSISLDSTETATTGTTFNVTISGLNLLVRYTTTNIGLNASFKYSIRRWS